MGNPPFSHESINQRIYDDNAPGWMLHRTLRCQKARRKRQEGCERRGTIHTSFLIEQLPAIIDSGQRFGDWERTWSSALDRQALVTLNKRKSRYSLIAEKLDAEFFFVHPYAFWERVANENMNDLIRRPLSEEDVLRFH